MVVPAGALWGVFMVGSKAIPHLLKSPAAKEAIKKGAKLIDKAKTQKAANTTATKVNRKQATQASKQRAKEAKEKLQRKKQKRREQEEQIKKKTPLTAQQKQTARESFTKQRGKQSKISTAKRVTESPVTPSSQTGMRLPRKGETYPLRAKGGIVSKLKKR